MSTEDMKALILEEFRKHKDIEFEFAPEMYLRGAIRDALISVHGVREKKAGDIAGGVSIDVSGLGLDYREHKEFLDEIAGFFAELGLRLWNVADRTVGPGYAMKAISNLKIGIPVEQ